MRPIAEISIMKTFYASTGLTLLATPFEFLPKVSLLVMMFIAMVVDFGTGIAKAYILKQKITSKALRRTITKFSQYGGALLIGMGISYMSNEMVEHNKSWQYAPGIMSWFNNGLILFIISIETKSIIENLAAMDKNSVISKNLFQPALKILNIQIGNNPVAKLTIETDDEIEVTQDVIKSKNIVP